MAEQHLTILMVAEKPSIAKAIAEALAPDGSAQKRKGISPSAPVFEVRSAYLPIGGQRVPASLRVTSTVGHMWSLDFPKELNDQNKVDPLELFDAPTAHYEDPRPRMSEHLWQEAAGKQEALERVSHSHSRGRDSRCRYAYIWREGACSEPPSPTKRIQ